ncbi:cryptochrome/photolyase family protein [Alteribacter natronophilus]|uniref:cryptochrome/photolyase family protein n=1 Tax=Alteribacter natronophilus TaxID=2583810 RepID=UPI00110E00ED|nr:deoxyribodipyrimidine photo-lyase [Alteribacter natronophilus]TMW70628.1 deoxyribodipyrimidine photo-lyase [Alteribacter natronophilus]
MAEKEQRERYAVWFRSDFRLEDQAALYHALETVRHKGGEWFAFFHLEPAFTESIDLHHDYFFRTLEHFRSSCKEAGIHLHIVCGELEEVLERFHKTVPGWKAVFFNRDDAGVNGNRDEQARAWFDDHNIDYFDYEDAHLHGPGEITKQDGTHYKVFTPYAKAWGKEHKPECYDIDIRALADYHADLEPIHEKGETFFTEEVLSRCSGEWKAIGPELAKDRLETFMDERLTSYKDERDLPDRAATSRLSPYLKTGVLSPRQVYHSAAARREDAGSGAETYITELAWRDFYYMIHYFYPDAKDQEVSAQYRNLDWNDSEKYFNVWKEGRTGFPIVDAGMRQLNETGWMHNRLRMITASFLTKDFHIDWRKGEQYFQQKLIDYDASSNIGGWQWAASVGTDAVPYFRVFNPTTQGKRFDPEGTFIRKYVPELERVPDKYIHEPSKMPEEVQMESTCVIGEDYPMPAVDHKTQRKKAIEMFKGEN